MSAFEKMISTCCLWVLAYLIVLIIATKVGVGSNVLKHVLKRFDKLRKLCFDFQMLLKAKNFSIQSKKPVLMLAKITSVQKSILRLFTAYLYDDKEDKDVKAAKEYVVNISDLCRKALLLATEGSNAEIDDFFKQIDSEISSAEALVKKALEYDIKSELLKI